MKRFYSRTFLKKLEKHEYKLRQRIMEAISKIPSGDIKKIKGRKLKNLYRLRVGKYRVIFLKKEDGNIYILDMDSRGDIYK